jgi:hypothetical protein
MPMSSKGGSGRQIVGYRYIMALHSGISRGPVNEFNEIRVGDLEVWNGNMTVTGSDTINAPEAFGGDEKEGGIVGTFRLFMGDPDQVIDSIITDNMEGDNPVPPWRGTCTFFFYGQIGSNNPYPKSWKFRVRRSTAGWDNNNPWYPETCKIVLAQDAMVTLTFIAQPEDKQYIVINGINAYFREAEKAGEYDVKIGGSIDETVQNFGDMVNFYADTVGATAVVSGNIIELRGTEEIPVVETPFAFVLNKPADGDIHAMNPAHIIYECATNNVWGRGLPASMIDDAGFRAVADRLYAENFGLCIRWNRADDIDRFVQSVVDHIGAAVYVSRTTGLLTLKLLRNDYDPDALVAFNFTNGLIDITEDQTSSTDTMLNEIIVEYNDPITDKIGQVRVQNLASFQALGSLVSQTVQYHGCATATMALKLAQRDLELHSSELRRLNLKFTRVAWKISPGDVIKINVPSRGIDNLLLRVGEVTEDPVTGEAVSVKAVQDVFGLPETTIVDPQETFWKPPDRTARVITERKLTEMTYFDLADTLPSTSDITPDTGWIKMFARQPSGASIQYDLQSKTSSEAYATRTTAGFDATATLVGALSHYDTSLLFTGGSQMTALSPGDVVYVDDEYMRLDGIDVTASTLTVARGVADTIPAAHADKTRLWVQTAMPTTDFRDYAQGEEVFVRLLTRTTTSILDPAYPDEDSIVITPRQGRPYPPGDMRVNDTPFAEHHHVIDGDITLSWTHRDRIVQGNTLLEHGAASTGPEPGTTYTVRVYGPDGVTLLHTESGLSGTDWTYTRGAAMSDGDPSVMWFRVESVRDSYISHQYYWFYVSRTIGFDGGFDYVFDGSL